MKKIKLENGESVILKAVPNFEDLWINVDGTVIVYKGLPRRTYYLRGKNQKQDFLQTSVNGLGYYVHRLVAMAYHGTSDKKFVIHLDGNTLNNFYKNLTWATPIEKYYNEVSNGTFKIQKQVSKLPDEDHPKIIERLKNGEPMHKIAKEYNTSDMSVHRLKMKYKNQTLW